MKEAVQAFPGDSPLVITPEHEIAASTVGDIAVRAVDADWDYHVDLRTEQN